MQSINESWTVRLDVIDVRDSAADVERRTLEQMTAEVLDPAVLPLVSWRLLRIAEHRHVLLHVEHHYVHDGWSFRVFLAELSRFYSQALGWQAAKQPENDAVQFSTYCKWQRAWLASNEAKALQQRWRTTLTDAPLHLRLRLLETQQPAPTAARHSQSERAAGPSTT